MSFNLDTSLFITIVDAIIAAEALKRLANLICLGAIRFAARNANAPMREYVALIRKIYGL